MAQASSLQTRPILDEDVDAVGEFLHNNLRADLPASGWREALTRHWIPDYPNSGFQLRDDGRLVGVIGGIYSRQDVCGEAQLFCNTHSWCVLKDYRPQSLKLLLALMSQRDCHITALTPSPEAARIYRALKFGVIDDEQRIVFNLPRIGARQRVMTEPRDIEEVLSGQSARMFRDHRDVPQVEMVVLGRAPDPCLVVYRRRTHDLLWGFRRVLGNRHDDAAAAPRLTVQVRLAEVLHVSDRAVFAREHRAFESFLLLHRGFAVTKIDSRFLQKKPLLSFRVRNSVERMYYSRTLKGSDICGLYSELVVMES